MKYYSEVLDKVFDSEKECMEAENAEKKKTDEREKRAEEVEVARKQAQEAKARYERLLERYCKDYGTFRYKLNDSHDINDLFSLWF